MAFSALSRPVRVLVYAALTTGAFIIILLLLFTWFVRRPFPSVRGRIESEGISAPVDIFRDADGVPHIWAESSEDLYFAQGWVHAQDRAWQLEFQRRVGRGRLSEILGEKLVDTDRYLRTLGLVDVAEKEYQALSEPYKGWLESYAEGVSAYFASRPPGRLGLEFAILRLTGVKWDVEPWTPVDSLVWGKMVSLSLSKNAVHDIRRLNLIRLIGRAKKDEWYGQYREDMPVTVSVEELAAFRQALGIEDEMPPSTDSEPNTGGNDGVGTNVWALSPGLTENNHAFLMSDMHLAVQMPSIWHELGMHVVPVTGSTEEPLHVRGYVFPGIPGIVSGQNENIAWGQSVLRGDVQDYFIEQINPEDPDLYRVGDSWEKMDITYETIHVKGLDEPVIQRVRKTRNGPVITDLERYGDLGSYFYDENLAFSELSLSWTSLSPGSLIESVLRYNRAENHEEFRDALSYWDSPSINFVYADAEGNIAYQAVGQYPIRPSSTARIPVPGWDKTSKADTFIPFDQLPASLNPAKGYVVSCNNAIVFEDYPFYIGKEYSPGFRARRISEIVENRDSGLSNSDIRMVLMDTYSLQAEETFRYFQKIDTDASYDSWLILKDSWEKDVVELNRREQKKKTKDESSEREILVEARQVLDNWDYDIGTDSAGAAAFAYIWLSLIEETFADQLPDHFWPTGIAELENTIYRLLQDPKNDWWDDRRTREVVEERDDILGRSLVRGLLNAAEEMGDKPAKWTWGDVHQVEFRNGTLGESGIAPIERIFNRGPYPIRGGNSQVHKTNWNLKEPFDAVVIPSQRAIYDAADPSGSLLMNTVGQSGHPFHRHYDDFIEPYLEGEYHPSRFTREEVEDSARGRHLILRPFEK